MVSETDPKRCLGCAYILEGLPEHRCPECGRGFDPDNPRTYFIRFRSGRRYLFYSIVAAVATFLGPVVAWLNDLGIIGSLPTWLLIVTAPFAGMLVPCGFVAECYILAWSIRVVRNRPADVRHPSAVVAALVISGVVVVGGGTIYLLRIARWLF